MNRLGDEIFWKIVELWFLGYTREEIIEQLNGCVSAGTVSSIFNNLPQSLVDLRDLAKRLKKQNFNISDCVRGFEVVNALNQIGKTHSDIKLMLDSFSLVASNEKCDLKLLVDSAMKMTELEKKTGKNYPEGLIEYELLIKENSEKKELNRKLAHRNHVLKEKIVKNENRQEKSLRIANEIPQDIADFKEFCSICVKNKIDLMDVKNLRVFIKNMESNESDIKCFVSICKKGLVLNRKVGKLDKEIAKKSQISSQQTAYCDQLYEKISNLIRDCDQLERKLQAMYFDYRNNLIKSNNLTNQITELKTLKDMSLTDFGHLLGMSELEIKLIQMESDCKINVEFWEKKILERLMEMRKAYSNI
jgi:hypothetical protein